MRKIIIAIIIVVLTISLSGCKKLDINQLYYVTAIGIDKADDGVRITVQVINPDVMSMQPRQISPFTVMTSEGKTVLEALRKLSSLSSNRLFSTHIQILLFGEEAAKDGIEKYMNIFFTDHETQHQYDILVVMNQTAEDTLKILTADRYVSSLSIELKLINYIQVYGASIEMSAKHLINDLRTEGVELSLPGIKVIGDPKDGASEDNVTTPDPKTYIVMGPISVFKGDKLIGWLSEKESLAYSFIMGEIKSTVIPVEIESNRWVSCEVHKSTSKIKLEIKDNKPIYNIDISANVTIAEDTSGNIQSDLQYINNVKNKFNQELVKMIEDCLKKLQQDFNSDTLKLGVMIYRKDPKYWKSISQNYDEIFRNLDIQVNINTEIVRSSY